MVILNGFVDFDADNVVVATTTFKVPSSNVVLFILGEVDPLGLSIM